MSPGSPGWAVGGVPTITFLRQGLAERFQWIRTAGSRRPSGGFGRDVATRNRLFCALPRTRRAFVDGQDRLLDIGVAALVLGTRVPFDRDGTEVCSLERIRERVGV